MPSPVLPEINPVTKRFVDAEVDANHYGSSTGGGGGASDAELRDRSTHTGTQPLSTLSQSGATSDQVPQWNGSAWVPATVSAGGSTPDASTTVKGIVELATTAEATTGTDTVRAVTPAGVKAVADTKAAATAPGLLGRYVGINAQTGTTYTPALADEGKLITLSNAAAVTVTLPQDSALAFPLGGSFDAAQWGAGAVSFQAGTGATVRVADTAVTRKANSVVTVIKAAANTWLVAGDLV